MKYTLSQKAKKYFAQQGLQVPYQYPYEDNTTPFDLGQIDQNLYTAQQNQMVQNSLNKVDLPKIEQKNPSLLEGAGNAIPLVSSIIKLGTGIKSLFDAKREKKRAEMRKRNAKLDLERRAKESRENDFYQTPYTTGSYSNFNKKGGVYQDGGFLNYYNQMEQQNNQTQQTWETYYEDYVNQKEQEAEQLRQQGLSDTIGGGLNLVGDVAKMVLQKGGLTTPVAAQESTRTSINNPNYFMPILKPENINDIENRRDSFIYNFRKEYPAVHDILMGKDPEKTSFPRRKRFYKDERMRQEGGQIEIDEDLYSEGFQSPVQQNGSYFQELKDKYQAIDPQGAFENQAMSWIFEEEPQPQYPLDNYMQSQDEELTPIPLKGDIATTHNNAGNIKFGEFAKKYGATPGRQATDGGKFAHFPDIESGLQAQKDLLTSGSYKNLTVANAMKRWSNSGYGADLYPEVSNKKMTDLSPQELNELILRQTKRESPTIYKKIYGK